MQNIKSIYTTQCQKRKNCLKKRAEDLNRHFSREDIQIGRWKNSSTSLIVTERQIKTTIRYHLTPLGIIKKTTNNKCWWARGEKGAFVHCIGDENWHSHYQHLQEDSSEFTNRTTIQSSNSTPGYLFKENKNINLKRYWHPSVHWSIVYNS